jgi:carboxypeptidase family protein
MAFACRARLFLLSSALVVVGCLVLSAPSAWADAIDGRGTAVEIATDGTEYASSTFAVAHQSHEEWFRYPVQPGMAYRIDQRWDQDAGVQTSLYGSGVEPIDSYRAYGTPPPSSRWVRTTAGGYCYVRLSSSGSASLGSAYTLSVIERPLDEVVSAIGGSVTREPGGGPAGGASITIWHADPLFNEPAAAATAGPGGAWSAELLPGSYVVRFDDPTALLTGEYYDHLTHVRPGLDEPTAVQVGEAAAVTGIDGALALRGRVAGRVVSSLDGAGIEGVPITSRSALGDRTAVTGTGGSFAFEGVDTGWPQRVIVADITGWHAVTAETQPFAVAPGGAYEVTLTMQPTAVVTGRITGRVTGPVGGAALAGIDVTLVARDSGASIAATVTGASGLYAFEGVGAGPYLVRFADPEGLHGGASVEVDVVAGGEATADAGLAPVLPPAPLVPTRVSIGANRTTVARRQAVYFSGDVSPNQPAGASVVLYVQRRGTHVWKRLGRRTLTRGHRWTFRYAPGSRGVYYLQARFAGDAAYAASSSPPKRLTVR